MAPVVSKLLVVFFFGGSVRPQVVVLELIVFRDFQFYPLLQDDEDVFSSCMSDTIRFRLRFRAQKDA